MSYAFASDNTAPMTPEALEAIRAANDLGCVGSYGDDPTTEQATARLRDLFETDCEVFFTFSGTAANALTVAAVCDSYESVFCHGESHLEKDESAAPEFFRQGLKLHLCSGPAGKVDLAQAAEVLRINRGVHSPQPRMISVTQATELGTVYRPAELQAVAEFARRHGLAVHMDGARFANAVASLGCRPADVTWRVGVDVLCFGGTKNGIGLSEAVVFFDRSLTRGFGHRRKQGGQLASKHRFLAAPWLGAIEGGRWLERAAHANAMARALAAALTAAGARLAFPVEANGVFIHLGQEQARHLGEAGWHFYLFLGADIYRFMCSWRTTADEIAALARAVAETAVP